MNVRIDNKLIKFQIPKDKFENFNLTKYNVDEFARIIEIGIYMVENSDQKILSMSNEAFNEKVENIKKQYISRENQLKEKNILYENRIANIEKVFNEEKKEALSRLKTTLNDEYSITINSLKKNTENLENKLNSLNTDWLNRLNSERKENQERFINERRENQETINKLNKDHREELSKIREIYDEKIENYYSSLNDMNKLQDNSSLKGKIGEIKMNSTLNMLFPKCEIEDTHKQPNRGDFVLTNENEKKILLDNKDYNKNVPKCEIEKFKRDMIVNNDVHAGILASNKTGIARKNDYEIDVINNKPVIYLHNTDKNNSKIKIAADFLFSIVQCPHIDLKNKEVLDAIKSCSDEFRKKLIKIRRDINKFTLNLTNNIVDVENIVNKIIIQIGLKK